MKSVQRIAAALAAASAVAFAPTAFASEARGAATSEGCTCKAHVAEQSKATPPDSAERAKKAQAEQEEHDEMLRVIWTAP